MTDPALELKDVYFSWPAVSGFSLSCPDFRLASGERVLLLGESGAGKSTLLSLVCGIVTAQSGSIFVNGTNLATLSAGRRDHFRAEQIGIIFQQFNLLPYARVMDNILLPLRFAPQRRSRAENVIAKAKVLCADLGLPEGITSEPAGRLSVGQQQRVAVARALIGQPPLIVADEPTSALDAATQDSFLSLLFEQCSDAGSSLLMVSHDAQLGSRFDRVVQLSDIATTGRKAA